ncbi:hypothetical protein [Nannocystis pusilla]|uniref:hypothetical protein n=1 Tax=Nannocystis pusilla TaxID=889268 RepID=UPI003DA24B2A
MVLVGSAVVVVVVGPAGSDGSVVLVVGSGSPSDSVSGAGASGPAGHAEASINQPSIP